MKHLLDTIIVSFNNINGIEINKDLGDNLSVNLDSEFIKRINKLLKTEHIKKNNFDNNDKRKRVECNDKDEVMIDKRTRSKKAKKNEVINLSDNKNDKININKQTDCLNKNDIVNNIDNGVVDISNKDNNELS